MTQKRKLNMPVFILGIVLLIGGLIVAAFYDRAIDEALYNPTFFPAIFMECFGYVVLYLSPICLCALAASDSKLKTYIRIICGTLAVAAIVGLNIYAIYSLDKRGVAGSEYISCFVWLAIIVILGCVFYKRQGEDFYKRAYFVCGWGTVYFVLELAVINIVKAIWMRTRFDDMLHLGSFDAFTPWYHPFGNGGSSFPSGHTASACGIFVLMIVVDVIPKLKKYRGLIFSACWLYVGIMAVTRMIMGRHFLSDTLSASAIMMTVFTLMTHSKLYSMRLNKLLASTGDSAKSAEASAK